MEKQALLEKLNGLKKGTLIETLGIEFTDVGAGYLSGRMPVDHRTKQPFGILHGGASLALAETLGSAATMVSVDMEANIVVGLEVKGNHLKQASEGYVYGKATPVHLGKMIQLWNVDISDEEGDVIASCRVTNIILEKKQDEKN